jgi:hypothetical protein
VAQLNLTTGDCLADKGKIGTNTAGFGLSIKEGTNAKMGTVTMNSINAVTVATTAVTTTSRIFLTIQTPAGATIGMPYVFTRTAGTSFQVKSLGTADTSVVAWMIVDPTP